MTITRFSTGLRKDDMLAGNTPFAASDMELISTIRVGSTAVSSVTFSAIPQEYKHLQIRGIVRTDRAATSQDDIGIQLNGDTGTNYSRHQLDGDGATASSYGAASVAYIPVGLITASGATAGMFGATVIDILDYSITFKNRTARALGGHDRNGAGLISLRSGAWLSTAAVTSIKLYSLNSANLVQYSKFSLYGIRG